jgi:hypothetical protein
MEEFSPNSFSVIVFDLHILCVARRGEEEPVGRKYAFPTWGGQELDTACVSIADTITKLKEAGWNDFRFCKAEAVQLTDFERVAKRIAQLAGGKASTPAYKELN